MIVHSLSLTAGGLLLASVAFAADFEATPAPYQTLPRPADGETLVASPPCFVYPATTIRPAYVVEYSREPQFRPETTLRLVSPYTLAVPTQTLAPGEYVWRWRPGTPDDGAAEWSAVRRFVMPPEVPQVPFPDIEKLVQRLGTLRPRIGVSAAGLPELRLHARERFGADWGAKVRQAAETLGGKPLLPEPAFLPDAKDPRRIEIYQKTFQATRPFMREMVTLAENYLLTGDELAGQEAKRRLLHVVGWDPRGSTSIGHNDEPATEVVRYCPTVYDRVYGLLSAEERQRCLDCLLIRMQDMMERWKTRPFEKHPYESHNMGYYLPDLLEASLALVGEAPVEEMLRYTMLQLWSPFYPPYGGADGGWCEGPSYWAWSTSVFARTYRLAEQTTGVQVQQRSNVRNMAFYKLYGNPPYSRLSPFGDGQESPAGGAETMVLLAALYENPYAQWYANWQRARLGPLDSLLLGKASVTAREPYDLPQGRAFFDVGLATMHTVLPDPNANVTVLLRSSPFGSISHAYADQNAFTLDAYGEPLIIASGYYQLYGHPHHAQWTWQTKASNSVLVNGEGQSTRDWNARGRLAVFQTTTAADYAVGDAHEAYPGRLERFDRRIVFLRPLHSGGAPVVIIRDDLAAPQPATYQFLLHALEKIDVDAGAQRLTVRRGAARCRVDVLAPQALAFEQNDRFTQPPFRPAPNQWHLTASTVGPAAKAESLIVLQPYRDGAEAALLTPTLEQGDGCVGVVLSAADRTLTVLLRTDPAAPQIRLGALSTDGQAASLRLTDNVVRSAVCFLGTSLAWKGDTLLESSQTTSLCGSVWGRDRRLADAVAPAGTTLATNLGSRDRWTQPGSGDGLRGADAAARLAKAFLRIADQPELPFTVTAYPRTQRLVAHAALAATGGHCELKLTLENGGEAPLPVSVSSGSLPFAQAVIPARQTQTLVVPAADLAEGRDLAVVADEAVGGQLLRLEATARRVYGVNLLPDPGFDQVKDGGPAHWQATSISASAQCTLAIVPGGRNGGTCIKVTCTEATGGTFGGILQWTGVAPAKVDRRFRMSCWVRSAPDSVAGLQVTSGGWQWWRNTERLRDQADWAETALEFVLPANTDLSNVRLHMCASKTGTELFADDVCLVELPPE
jgi:hypothetical protein